VSAQSRFIIVPSEMELEVLELHEDVVFLIEEDLSSSGVGCLLVDEVKGSLTGVGMPISVCGEFLPVHIIDIFPI
jgi:xanthine/uracil permease